MSKIVEELINNATPMKNIKLLDYTIAIQLNKIERYRDQSKDIIDKQTEDAMTNLVELLKIRSQFGKLR